MNYNYRNIVTKKFLNTIFCQRIKTKYLTMSSTSNEKRKLGDIKESTIQKGKNIIKHNNDRIKKRKIESEFQVKKLSDKATIPVRGSKKAAGYDLSSSEEAIVPANDRKLIKTDIAIALPSETYGRIAPRSGLALKYGIQTGAGVIDEDYRGPLNVLLFNHSKDDFKVKRGDRIAQLIIERIVTPEINIVDILDESERGEKGFGSTGISNDDLKENLH